MDNAIGNYFLGLTDYYSGGNVFVAAGFLNSGFTVTPLYETAKPGDTPKITGASLWGGNGQVIGVEETPEVVAEMVADFFARTA